MTLTLSNLKLFTLIGKGSYSNISVYVAKHTSTSQGYSVKRVNLEDSEFPIDHIQNEIWMMKYLRHQHILPLLSVHLSNHHVHLLSPLFNYGSCKDLIQSHFTSGLPELVIALVLKAVLSALQYLHSQHIIHRSIKASHVLVNSDGMVVLSGLRHCQPMVEKGSRLKNIHHFPDYYVQNLNWASRELLEQNLSGYNTMADIYSVGILCCELANGVVPFSDSPMTQMLLNRIEGQMPVLIDANTYVEFNDGASVPKIYQRQFTEHFHELSTKCLSYNPQDRPVVSTLLTHAFFKQTKTSPPPQLHLLLKPVVPLNLEAIKETDAGLEKDLAQLTINTGQWDYL